MSNKLNILMTYLKYKNKHFKDRDALESYQKKQIGKQLDFVMISSCFSFYCHERCVKCSK